MYLYYLIFQNAYATCLYFKLKFIISQNLVLKIENLHLFIINELYNLDICFKVKRYSSVYEWWRF